MVRADAVDAWALVDLWNRATEHAHPITSALWHEVTTGDPSYRSQDLIIAAQGGVPAGFALVKRMRRAFFGSERFDGVGFLSLLAVDPPARGLGVGRRLIEMATRYLMGEGATTLVLGGSFHHAVPGIPVALDGALDFFDKCGFTLGKTVWDVSRDVRGFEMPVGGRAALDAAGIEVRVLRTRYAMSEDPVLSAALLEFLAAEFPGRWLGEVSRALGRVDGESWVMVLLRADRVVGFAVVCPSGTAGTVRWEGFDPDVAAIGPLGVAKGEQGKGLGLALVAAATTYLARLGSRRVVIDWTEFLDFYGKLGYAPWLSYRLGSMGLG